MEARLNTVAEVTVAINEEAMTYEANRKELLKQHQLCRKHLRALLEVLQDREAGAD